MSRHENITYQQQPRGVGKDGEGYMSRHENITYQQQPRGVGKDGEGYMSRLKLLQKRRRCRDLHRLCIRDLLGVLALSRDLEYLLNI